MLGQPANLIDRHAGLLRVAGLLMALAALLLLVRSLPLEQPVAWLTERVESLAAWGPFLFGLLFVLMTMLLLPGTPIALAAGALFGPVQGTVIISLAATASAGVSFVLGHQLAHDWVARRVMHYPRLRTLYHALERKENWKLVAALRLSHAMPFGLQNLLLGVTPIGIRTYLVATWLSTLPGIFLFVYLGHLGASAMGPEGDSSPAGPIVWTLRVAGLVAAAVAVLYVTRLARRIFKSQIDIDLKPTQDLPPPVAQRAASWRTLAGLLGALAFLFLALWVHASRDSIRASIVSWFGE